MLDPAERSERRSVRRKSTVAARAWCAGATLPILAELPFQREAALAYAHGLPPTEAQGATGHEWRQRFAMLAARLREFSKGASHA